MSGLNSLARTLALVAATLLAAPLAVPLALAQATPQKGGTLVIVVQPEPPTLAAYQSTSGPVGQVTTKVFEGLLEYDFDLKPQPSLAKSWSVSADAKTITFNLQEGVKFHDGKPFTSADVQFSVMEALKKVHPRGPNTFRAVTAVDTPNPLTAVFRLSEPAPYMMMALSSYESPIVPKHIYAEGDIEAHPSANTPVGTGPFRPRLRLKRPRVARGHGAAPDNDVATSEIAGTGPSSGCNMVLLPTHKETCMRRQIHVAAIAALALSGCATAPSEPAGASKEMKLAFDFTDANPVVLLNKLNNVDVTRKQLIESGVTPKIVMTFRGNASFYTQTNLGAVDEKDRADAIKVAAKLREMKKAPGVQGLEQCNLPLADRKLKPADLMQEVKLVPNGWIALGGYQQQGYAYIAP